MASERTLVVDIGNTEITAGITSEDGVSFSPRFRLNNNSGTTADELGLSLRLMLRSIMSRLVALPALLQRL
jgi:pantothenate kinase type III